MDLCSPVWSVLPGHTKTSSLQCFPLGKREYWSKFRYNFIFYVDEMHLKGRDGGWRRGRGWAETVFRAHTHTHTTHMIVESQRLEHKRNPLWLWSLTADRN